jgi:hypothetical protein
MIPVCDAPFHAVLRGWFASWFAIQSVFEAKPFDIRSRPGWS